MTLSLKVHPLLASAGLAIAAYSGSYLAMFATIGLSLALDLFHAVRSDTWNNLQDKLATQRGMAYQAYFNFFYSQFWGVAFRLIAFLAIGSAAPWTGAYWGPVILMALIGTFFGTLGYLSMNSMYDKGHIDRSGRLVVQGVREFFFMVAGTMMGLGEGLGGTLFWAWAVFTLQQSFDLGLYVVNRFMKTKPVIYVAAGSVASQEPFTKAYPPSSAPVKSAFDNLKGTMFLKPFVYVWDKLNPKAKP